MTSPARRRRRRSRYDLRCTCGRHPLLAVYGVDTEGKLYVHVRIWKQKRVYGEMMVTGGTVRLLCRECLRWNTVVIKQSGDADLVHSDAPVEIAMQT